MAKTLFNTPLKVTDLPPNYYMFGNKGTVWANEAHIAKSGFKTNGLSTTLCGTPMLSTNWARISELPTVGCQACLAKFKEMEGSYE